MVTLDDGLRRLYRSLAATGLPHFVGGSVGASFYGEPRSTHDIDIVLQATPGDAERIASAYSKDEFYVPPPSVLRAELARPRDGHFNVVDYKSGLKADLYVAGNDPLIAYGMAHAVDEVLEGVPIRVAPATYVVAMKLRYYGMNHQDKHLRDIRSILAIHPTSVDMNEVQRWASQFGASDAWERCRARPGEEDPG